MSGAGARTAGSTANNGGSRTRVISVPSRVPELLGYTSKNGSGGRDRTDGIVAYATRWRSCSTREKWWRLAVLLRALVVFSHAPSLDRLNLLDPDFTLRRVFYLCGTFTHPACAVLLFIQSKVASAVRIALTR